VSDTMRGRRWAVVAALLAAFSFAGRCEANVDVDEPGNEQDGGQNSGDGGVGGEVEIDGGQGGY
jgi:hypothetical protein